MGNTQTFFLFYLLLPQFFLYKYETLSINKEVVLLTVF
jgi:hypothetical protein